MSRFLNRKISHLFCIHCGAVHLDADYFAVHLHQKHLCHSCGKYFSDSRKSISNPIALMRDILNDADEDRQIIRAKNELNISQLDYPGGIQIWASNPAILWTVPRPENEGLHVHVYPENSTSFEDRIKDDTFDKVTIDGHFIDESMARHLMAQQALPYLKNKIVSLNCPSCDEPHFDQGENAFVPHKNHGCRKCSRTFPSVGKRRLVVSNPLLSVFDKLR